MASTTLTCTAAGPSTSLAIAPRAFSERSGVGLVLSITGTLTASVELSGDNGYPPVHWIAHDTLVNLTASGLGNLAFAVKAIRLNVTNYTSGEAHLAVVQPVERE